MDRETLESYLSQARAEGKFDSAGTFTIDYAQAREKLAAFQFQKPEYYLLKFVQAAVAMKSQAVEFRLAPESIEVRFVRPEAELLPEQFGALVTDAHDAHLEQHCRDLALAVCGSSASNICFRDTGSGREVTIQGESLEFTELGSLRGDAKLLFFLGHDRPLPKKVLKQKAEVLRAACQFAPVPLMLEGKQINESRTDLHFYQRCLESPFPAFWGEVVVPEKGRSGLGLPSRGRAARVEFARGTRTFRDEGEVWVRLRDESPGHPPTERARLLLLAGGPLEGPSKLYFVQYGVMLSEQTVRTAFPGVRAVLCVDGHPTDLSGFQLIESDLLKAEVREVSMWAERLYGYLIEELDVTEPVYLQPPLQPGPSAVVGGVVAGGLLGLVAGPYGSVFGAFTGAALGKALLQRRARMTEPRAYLEGALKA